MSLGQFKRSLDTVEAQPDSPQEVPILVRFCQMPLSEAGTWKLEGIERPSSGRPNLRRSDTSDVRLGYGEKGTGVQIVMWRLKIDEGP